MSRTSENQWESRFVQIVYERGHTIFFERFLLAVEVKYLLIVSPWITSLANESVTLRDITHKINAERIKTQVFTRNPKKEPTNEESVQIFSSCPTVEVFLNDELHAKVYVCRCSPFGFALVGSANLSGRATRALEIGLMIDGRGKGQDIIEELEKLGKYDLYGRAGTNPYPGERFSQRR